MLLSLSSLFITYVKFNSFMYIYSFVVIIISISIIVAAAADANDDAVL